MPKERDLDAEKLSSLNLAMSMDVAPTSEDWEWVFRYAKRLEAKSAKLIEEALELKKKLAEANRENDDWRQAHRQRNMEVTM